jgi:hypothetical protein
LVNSGINEDAEVKSSTQRAIVVIGLLMAMLILVLPNFIHEMGQ